MLFIEVIVNMDPYRLVCSYLVVLYSLIEHQCYAFGIKMKFKIKI
jgi:hypothetical protein